MKIESLHRVNAIADSQTSGSKNRWRRRSVRPKAIIALGVLKARLNSRHLGELLHSATSV